MSLINDALKKAQRERTNAPEHPATVTPSATPPPANHGQAQRGELRARSNPWPALLVVLALVGGGAAVWFLKPGGRPSSTPATVAANNQTPATPAAAPTTPEPAAAQLQINLPGTAAAPAPAATPAAAVSPVAHVPAPLPAVAAVPPTLATQPAPASTLSVQTTPAPLPTAAVQPAPQPAATAPAASPEQFKVTLQMEDPRILAFLDAARINGIRSVADDAKLLMNNKVFRAGSIVDRDLGLKLVQILPNELVFEDAHGIQYRKIL
jgi:hypothetical protein